MRTIGVVVAGLVLAGSGLAAPEPAAAFKVIVNSGRPGQTVPREVLAQIYLGNAQRWGDGKLIVPVDLSATSPTRAAFSALVLQMPVERVQHHWLRSLGTGRVPPKTKSSDDEVIAFVAREAGGVGYVSAGAVLPDSVRAVAVQ